MVVVCLSTPHALLRKHVLYFILIFYRTPVNNESNVIEL